MDRGESQMNGRGIRPELRKNGANPVLSDRDMFIANSIAGSLETQSFWEGCMHCLIMVVRVRLARSVDPSDSGW